MEEDGEQGGFKERLNVEGDEIGQTIFGGDGRFRLRKIYGYGVMSCLLLVAGVYLLSFSFSTSCSTWVCIGSMTVFCTKVFSCRIFNAIHHSLERMPNNLRASEPFRTGHQQGSLV